MKNPSLSAAEARRRRSFDDRPQIQADTVLLEVTERFVGDVADRVEVTQVDGVSSDFSGVPFTVGQNYLVGAIDGTITGCGVTGADDADLRAVYDAAFPG